jgi:hypothetical protein
MLKRQLWSITRLGVLAAAFMILVGDIPSAAASQSWLVQSSPNPSGSTSNYLQNVSCHGVRTCVSVGYTEVSNSTELPLVERWDGKTWVIQDTPSLVRPNGSPLNGVSCVSSRLCIAVGGSAFYDGTLAERWNGKVWTVLSTPNPNGNSGLGAVSCTSARSCMAVGGNGAGAPNLGTLAEQWNGKTWFALSTLNPDGEQWSAFSDVSCASPKSCMAVGSYFNADNEALSLGEYWNGREWSISPTQDAGPGTQLYGVACTSVKACIAVGTSGFCQCSITEVWNGTTWTLQSSPSNPPLGAAFYGLNGVACVSSTACTADGDYTLTPGGDPSTLVEQWAGGSWTVVSSPNVSGVPYNLLRKVSCSTNGCTGVGWWETSSEIGTLIERANS